MDYLNEIDERGFKYYFHYTVNGYPTQLEPFVPKLDTTLDTFSELAIKLGPDKLIWRYDPILISNITDLALYFFQKLICSSHFIGKFNHLLFFIGYFSGIHFFELLKKFIGVYHSYTVFWSNCPVGWVIGFWLNR